MNAGGFSRPGNRAYNAASYNYLYGRHPSYAGGVGVSLSEPEHKQSLSILAEPASTLDKGPQTVEQLISEGSLFIPSCDPELALLHDKKHASWLALDDCVGQIRERQSIYEQNMDDIEWGKCDAFNKLSKHGWPPSPEREYVFDKRMAQLYMEQRAERVAAWRDISRLRVELPESVQGYLSAFRKDEILKDSEGWSP